MPIAQGSAYLYNNTETVFLFTDPKWSFLSSTMIKEVARLGGDISEWVPANVLDIVRQKYEK
ncbi:MAG: pantetheine-phosphate adenylyltransferase, partial [Firmicutes bacterium]|nr:pantetheine-phosphate adenylyltransferase [Bacillota bacterium]